MAKIITSKPEGLWNLKCTLGEGTLWVKEHNSIYFTDIKKKRIHILNFKNKNGFASSLENIGIGINPNKDFIKEYEYNS